MHKYVGYMYRYIAPPAQAAVKEYQAVADTLALPLAPVALAFVYSRPFVTSTIIAATTADQLRDNVMALNLAPLSVEIIKLLDDVYRKHRDPCKV
jgi:aryl-alcohol dehydrogenase-like predicted oxidoreductase